MTPQESIELALASIGGAVAQLRRVATGMPTDQAHVFLQALGRFEGEVDVIRQLLVPVDA